MAARHGTGKCGYCIGPEGSILPHCQGRISSCTCSCTGRPQPEPLPEATDD